eukprot:Unigene6252_Nuclearia_a/m.19256 Unigene6252_Nuclearia_a/g.19256  ORF Unigene6252_Nuclearia_a/g.19256 Unigene6252_Nuclearia_a/m.19256 type:complete len:720 (-) Unigene6252_Nuclearia_a:301-2460(-)
MPVTAGQALGVARPGADADPVQFVELRRSVLRAVVALMFVLNALFLLTPLSFVVQLYLVGCMLANAYILFVVRDEHSVKLASAFMTLFMKICITWYGFSLGPDRALMFFFCSLNGLIAAIGALMVNEHFAVFISCISSIEVLVAYAHSGEHLMQFWGEVFDMPRTFTVVSLVMAEVARLWIFTAFASFAVHFLRRTVSELATTSESRRRFISTMSHEIRTPLVGILSMAEMLVPNQEISAETQLQINIICSSCRRLHQLINNVLDLSKIEAGMVSVEASPMSVQTVMQTASDMFASASARRGVRLAVSVDEGIPPIVLGDQARLLQVIGNLLSNAIKFTSDGEIRMSARAAEVTPSHVRVRFAVTDTGVGFDDKTFELFKPFQQASNKALGNGGSGLGLSICKELVEMMHGSISCTSTVGKGTTVVFTVAFALDRPGSGAGPHDADTVLAVSKPKLSTINALESLAAEGLMDVSAVAVERVSRPSSVITPSAPGRPPEDDEDAGDDSGLVASHSADFALPGAGGTDGEHDDDGQAQQAGMRARSHSHNAIRRAAAQVPDTVGSHALSILVAEDNQINRFIISKQLGRLGHSHVFAFNGQEAVDLFRTLNVERRVIEIEGKPTGAVDLVLMDLSMPVKDGIEATADIRRLEAANGQAPVAIIALTADDEERRSECLRCGMDDLIMKPVSLEKLAGVIGKHARPTERPAHSDCTDTVACTH